MGSSTFADASPSTDSCALSFARSDGTVDCGLPVVLALHRKGEDAAAALSSARQLFGAAPEVVAPQAARPCNPFQSNLASAKTYSGFSWYLGDDFSRPEAASFGDALAQLDLFARRLGRPFALAGTGQGGALALALALHAPAQLVAVWAEGTALPFIEGWQRPHRDLSGVHIALAECSDDQATAACTFFQARGAQVRMFSGDSASEASNWLQSLRVASRTTPEDLSRD